MEDRRTGHSDIRSAIRACYPDLFDGVDEFDFVPMSSADACDAVPVSGDDDRERARAPCADAA